MSAVSPFLGEVSDQPEGWAEICLGDLISRIEAGKNLRCREQPPLSGEKGIIKISAVTWGEFLEDESKTLDGNYNFNTSWQIRPGDFLISRANTIELVGACVIVRSVNRTLMLSDKVLRFHMPDEWKEWLLLFLRSSLGRFQIENLATGNQLSMRNISQENLRRIVVPLPPLPEQKRTVEKLRQLLSCVNGARKRLANTQTILKRFRQAVLAAACSGRLTAEWRSANGVDRDDWRLVKLAEVAEMRLGKMLDKAKNVGKPTPYLRNLNVRWFAFDLSDLAQMRVAPEERTELTIKDGDLLVCEGGEPGRCAVWNLGSTDVAFQKAIHRVRLGSKVIPLWIAFNLKNDADSGALQDYFTGSTIKHLTGRSLKSYALSLPSLAEQKEIVRQVDALFKLADAIEERVSASTKRAEKLTQAILAKAFRGELVPTEAELARREGRSYESTSDLLTRIRSERDREQTAPVSKQKKRPTRRKRKAKDS